MKNKLVFTMLHDKLFIAIKHQRKSQKQTDVVFSKFQVDAVFERSSCLNSKSRIPPFHNSFLQIQYLNRVSERPKERLFVLERLIRQEAADCLHYKIGLHFSLSTSMPFADENPSTTIHFDRSVVTRAKTCALGCVVERQNLQILC